MIINLFEEVKIINKPDGEYEYQAKIQNSTVLFNDASQTYNHLMAVKHEDKLLRLNLKDAAPTSTIVTDTTVTYPEAFKDVDIIYTVSNEKVKEDILIKTAEARHSFEFSTLEDNITSSFQEDGSVIYKDTEGNTIWTIEAPFAYDADGKDLEVYLVYSDNYYSVEVLTDDSTAYPIVLDPTITMGNTTYLGHTGIATSSSNSSQTNILRFEDLGFRPSSLTVNVSLTVRNTASSSFRYYVRDAEGTEISTKYFSAPYSGNVTINIPAIASSVEFQTVASATNTYQPTATSAVKLVNMTTEDTAFLMHTNLNQYLTQTNSQEVSFVSEITATVKKFYVYSSYPHPAPAGVNDPRYLPEEAIITSIKIDGEEVDTTNGVSVTEGQTITLGLKSNNSAANYANFVVLTKESEGPKILFSRVAKTTLSSTATRTYNPSIYFGSTLVKNRAFNRSVVYKTPSEDVYFKTGDTCYIREVAMSSTHILASLTMTYYNSDTVLKTETANWTGSRSMWKVSIPENTNKIVFNIDGYENTNVSNFTGYFQFYAYSTTYYAPRVLNAADLPGYAHIRFFAEDEINSIGSVNAVFADTPPEHFIESVHVNGEEKTDTFDIPARSWVDIFVKGVGVNTPASSILGFYFEEASTSTIPVNMSIDTKRFISVSDSIINDTLRASVTSSLKQVDTYRRTTIESVSIYDTRRDILETYKEDIALDTKRTVSKSINSLFDTKRLSWGPIEQFIDVKRKVVVTNNLILDTKRDVHFERLLHTENFNPWETFYKVIRDGSGITLGEENYKYNVPYTNFPYWETQPNGEIWRKFTVENNSASGKFYFDWVTNAVANGNYSSGYGDIMHVYVNGNIVKTLNVSTLQQTGTYEDFYSAPLGTQEIWLRYIPYTTNTVIKVAIKNIQATYQEGIRRVTNGYVISYPINVSEIKNNSDVKFVLDKITPIGTNVKLFYTTDNKTFKEITTDGYSYINDIINASTIKLKVELLGTSTMSPTFNNVKLYYKLKNVLIVDTVFDTKRKSVKPINILTDTFRSIVSSAGSNYATKRIISNTNSINIDTLREVLSQHEIELGLDTKRIVLKNAINNLDTKRLTKKPAEAIYDTKRYIVTTNNIEVDTKRMVTLEDDISLDSERSIIKDYLLNIDTNRRISAPYNIQLDTKREVVKVIGSTITKLDTLRHVWKSTNKYVFPYPYIKLIDVTQSASGSISGVSSYDLYPKDYIAANEQATEMQLNYNKSTLSAFFITFYDKSNVKISEAAYPTTGTLNVTIPANTYRIRFGGNVQAQPGMIGYVKVDLMSITAKSNGFSYSIKLDTKRTTNNLLESLYDTKRQLTRESNISIDIDTKRIVIAPESIVLDTRRKTSILNDSIYDSIRKVVIEDISIHDIYRGIIVTEESIIDTSRLTMNIVTEYKDTLRKISSSESTIVDTSRLAAAKVYKVLDTKRRITLGAHPLSKQIYVDLYVEDEGFIRIISFKEDRR